MQIAIIDLGSQYTYLIARSLRELGVRSVVLAPQNIEPWFKDNKPKGIILSGGAASIYDEDAPSINYGVLVARGVPILSICLGMHGLVKHFRGKVVNRPVSAQYGPADFTLTGYEDRLFKNIPAGAHAMPRSFGTVWMSHGDSVDKINGLEMRVLGVSDGVIAAVRSLYGPVWGLQFHPEVRDTQYGKEIFRNFLEICGTTEDWKPVDIIQEIREEVLQAVPEDARCILAFSGGVDSTTLAAILAPVLKERLICLTVDAGQLREGEIEEIKINAIQAGCAPVIVSCKEIFLGPLGFGSITDAEIKREVFQRKYKYILEEEAKRLSATYLIQATLEPDRIESADMGQAVKIKTHHNVGFQSWLKQLHPFRLFKDEVRELARALGLSSEVSERMPFPGPGLFIRIVGVPVNEERLETVRWAHAKVRKIVRKTGLESEISQLVVALIGVKTVGVGGDHRIYTYPIAVRAVKTFDFMTCSGYEFPPEIRRRIKKVLAPHRVWFDENDKPPATVEFE